MFNSERPPARYFYPDDDNVLTFMSYRDACVIGVLPNSFVHILCVFAVSLLTLILLVEDLIFRTASSHLRL